ncbi:hypothetical protein BDW02DRAFT_585440 [Decorospora gaudefroyi]|uniref:Macro domain-containing protein n=1 Tax=Decorospora gaudefroyi TaxID=184978 RepID=A0A6A5KPD8_9PLEO|nr:hypothetical protein BDW02DRAFT_585440 [Decorospora gaudefroyi]
MSSLRLATAANVRALQSLSAALSISDGKWAKWIDGEALEDEVGRFRVWSGNLGALQKGHSSLDYRLRDSPLLSNNALKLLEELADNVNEAYAIISGARLPYEAQPKSEELEDNEDDGSFFSENEDEDDAGEARSELKMRFEEMVDIVDNLYKLGVRIRTPTIRSRSFKAVSYAPKDPETGIDVLGAYAAFDLQHVQELLSHLRQPYLTDGQDGQDFLTVRLSAAVTLRRRHFKYWKRHRDKLGAAATHDEPLSTVLPVADGPNPPSHNDALETQVVSPIVTALKEAASQKTGRTLMSGTEATHHHQSLDEMVDTKSVTSYAVTVKDIYGRGVNLPAPPKTANGDKDFECPYCYIICPARYGRGRPWRTHLLQDLQPYCCTYPDCDSSEQIFRSRREWAEHEASHRKVWRCPEHPSAVYNSQSRLEDHLRENHLDSFPASQLATIVKVGETATVDLRTKCPICYAPVDTEGLGEFQNHIANHLERISTFALPSGIDDGDDGASSVASRGASRTSGSQHMSEMSLPNDTANELDEHENAYGGTPPSVLAPDPVPITDTGRTLLSAASLQQLPDDSQNRLSIFPDQVAHIHDSEDGRPEDEEPSDYQTDDTPADIQEHLEQRETFRRYMMSLPGVETVRFYRRYGSWTGQVNFQDNVTGAEAISLFDFRRFPNIKFQRKDDTNRWKFTALRSTQAEHKIDQRILTLSSTSGNRLPPSRKSTTDKQDQEDEFSVSSGNIAYEGEDDTSSKQPILSVTEILTISSLYRSRRLAQRDQSYAPNDVYNRMIAFCYHDLTRLKLDAIVNSANFDLKIPEATDTLSRAVHKAGGPGLTKEAKSKARIKAGQVELTHGHDLPASWVIHAATPTYTESTGMGQFNILTECYRSALKMAGNYEIKTLAFPCLGTGGSGFPPRVAARIALQEVREYLDVHTDTRFERIVFCMNTAADEKAYMDFFPVFFPPTHGDLDRARELDTSISSLYAQILETCTQIRRAREDISINFSGVPLPELIDTDSSLQEIEIELSGIRKRLPGSEKLKQMRQGDLVLLLDVMLTVCGSIVKMTQLANDAASSGRTFEEIWKDKDSNMLKELGMNTAQFLHYCEIFCYALEPTSVHSISDDIPAIRLKLQSHVIKHRGQNTKVIRHDLTEVLHAREKQRETAPYSREVVKLQQIPSVAGLYQLGELDTKPTLAQPSVIFNHIVCLIREDITRLEVDIMVNSTDVSFLGMGTLDRSIFKKGGSGLREEVKKFEKCKEGDVKMTPGYLLPAKHILHVIPPEQYRKKTKGILRNIYRELLHTASIMKATSVAIPSIGTGMLNFPMRDCASLAIEEVKRFLESADSNNPIEKIIFTVYSSNDELIYKSLLPIHFPPPQLTAPAHSGTRPVDIQRASSLSRPDPTPRRSLFGSVGEAFHSVVRSGKQPETPRLNAIYEQRHAFNLFESHAHNCSVCKDSEELYAKGQGLCENGHALAQSLLLPLVHLDIEEDGEVYSKPDNIGIRHKMEVPVEIYPLSKLLLRTVAKSVRDKRPFVASRGGAANSRDDA